MGYLLHKQIVETIRMSAPQYGGMVGSFQTLISNLDSPIKLVYGLVIILVIVYSTVIPTEYRIFADSLLGRVLGLGAIYGIIQTLGWVYGLLTALAFLLVLNGAPRYGTNDIEGFDGGGSVSEKKIIGRRWFVERVLGENPKKIATDQVSTFPVQD
jgi:hypothetical protein